MAKPTIRADVSHNLQLLVKKFPQLFTKSFAEQFAKDFIDEMKKDVARGISPIKGNGRFPAYKGAGLAGALSKSASKASGARRKELKESAVDIKRRSYPFSVQHKFPNKRQRPVNLYLSGDFLRDLDYKIRGLGDKFHVAIGFFSGKSVQKERGHREGANGQPERPIIPQNKELFSEKLQRFISNYFKKHVKKLLAK